MVDNIISVVVCHRWSPSGILALRCYMSIFACSRTRTCDVSEEKADYESAAFDQLSHTCVYGVDASCEATPQGNPKGPLQVTGFEGT